MELFNDQIMKVYNKNKKIKIVNGNMFRLQLKNQK